MKKKKINIREDEEQLKFYLVKEGIDYHVIVIELIIVKYIVDRHFPVRIIYVN